MSNNVIVLSDEQLSLLKEQLAIGDYSDHHDNRWKSDGMIRLIESVDLQTKNKSSDTTKICVELPNDSHSVTRFLGAIEEYFHAPSSITLTPDITAILDGIKFNLSTDADEWNDERAEFIEWFTK